MSKINQKSELAKMIENHSACAELELRSGYFSNECEKKLLQNTIKLCDGFILALEERKVWASVAEISEENETRIINNSESAIRAIMGGVFK
jgi:hypothetical protein